MVARLIFHASVAAACIMAAHVLAADSLQQAIASAQQSNRPIFVVAGGKSCPYCRELEKEMQAAEVAAELSRWVVAHVDIDDSPNDAQALAVRAIPALRLLTPAGKVVAAREGALSASKLIEWVKEHYDAASATLAPELTATGELTALQAVRLVRELGRRDPTVREAAIRRLTSNASVAAPPVASAFVDGSLLSRLAALEILTAWKAPVEGLDPWRPETITQERLQALSAWAANPQVAAADASIEALSKSLSRSAEESIERMLTAPLAEALAIRERLAKHGRLLMPLVYDRLRAAQTDEARQRLTALRYRLAATDELALTWPGGIERLAAADARLRREAMDELSARASPADEALLLELFSDTEPLIRELALAALYKTGGNKANSALVRLLNDPDPNVQVAVLKQLAEAPAHSALPRLRNYIEKQQDADLLVHAVRVLRATKSKAAVEILVSLLPHENWRVRAEAAEAIGEAVGGYIGGIPDEDKADAYVALVDLLQDEDAFVVSRAVQVLAKANLAIAVNPLAQVAERHPALAVEVVKALSHSGSAQAKVADHLRRFASHEDAKVRAAAVKGLCEVNVADLGGELTKALSDSAEPVRIAAAEGLFGMMNEELQRQSLERGNAEGQNAIGGSLVERGVAALGRLFAPDHAAQRRDEAAQSRDETAATAAEEPIKLPDWMQKLQPALQAMLKSESAGERLAAALPLVALGEYAPSLPVLETAISDDRGHIPSAAEALPWLPWPERKKFFAFLVSQARSGEHLAAIAQEMATRWHPAAAALVWELLAREDGDASLTTSLIHPVRTLYFGNRFYDVESIPKKQLDTAVQETRHYAENGKRWQRLAALSLLVSLDTGAAAEVATRLASDSSLDPSLRESAFRVMLFASEDDVAQKEAVLAIRSASEDRLRPALALLARGREALQDMLDDGVQLVNFGQLSFATEGAREAIPQAPEGLTADMLRPLLNHSEPAVRADAGYLLCLLGEAEGLQPLVERWKALGKRDEELTKAVYRSIAALDDAAHVTLLAEIYQLLSAKEDVVEQDVAAFYWTIRTMTGAEVLALRKRIRDDVGIENLQRNNPFGDSFPSSRF